jgi:hypothetical protein
MRLSDSRRQFLQTLAATVGMAALGNLPLAMRAVAAEGGMNGAAVYGKALTARELRRGLGLGS